MTTGRRRRAEQAPTGEPRSGNGTRCAAPRKKSPAQDVRKEDHACYRPAAVAGAPTTRPRPLAHSPATATGSRTAATRTRAGQAAVPGTGSRTTTTRTVAHTPAASARSRSPARPGASTGPGSHAPAPSARSGAPAAHDRGDGGGAGADAEPGVAAGAGPVIQSPISGYPDRSPWSEGRQEGHDHGLRTRRTAATQ